MSDGLRSSAPPGEPQGARRKLADRAWW
ncbi:MAG: hypothetical protein JWP79_2786, partial [Polaromonas sp.]|nr:hypothetical protein [Polaromonas sp.]